MESIASTYDPGRCCTINAPIIGQRIVDATGDTQNAIEPMNIGMQQFEWREGPYNGR
jgi:hypothetical protein